MRAQQIDIKDTAARALPLAEAICRRLFPAGDVDRGGEFRVGDIHGTPSKRGPGHGSLAVNLKTGQWRDRAQDDVKGGDLVALAAAAMNCSQLEAAEWIGETFLGGDWVKVGPGRRKPIRTAPPPMPAPSAPTPKPKESDWVPEGVPASLVGDLRLPPIHPKLGAPTAFFKYWDPERELFMGGVCRWDITDAAGNRSKEIRQCAAVRHRITGVFKLDWQGFAQPFPLFRACELQARPRPRVLITEGEKACRACAKLFEDAACITWPGGTGSVEKADWEQLKGFPEVTLWPDADEPGAKAMDKLATILGKMGVKVRRIDPAGLAKLWGVDCFPGWDAADALEQLKAKMEGRPRP